MTRVCRARCRSNSHAGGLNIGGTAVTSTAAELNILDGVTATATEINLLDGVTATTAEINYVDGVTSNIQTQLDAKQASIGDGDLSIAKINGLQTALDAKATSTALTSGLAGKQDAIADGDLTIARTNGLQAALDAKQATVTGAATTIVSDDLTGSRALTSNGSGKSLYLM